MRPLSNPLVAMAPSPTMGTGGTSCRSNEIRALVALVFCFPGLLIILARYLPHYDRLDFVLLAIRILYRDRVTDNVMSRESRV